MADQKSTYQRFIARLQAFRLAEKRQLLWSGIFSAAAVILPVLLIVIGIEALFDLAPRHRVILLAVTGIAVLVCLVYFLVKPVLALLHSNTPSLNHIALRIGRHYRHVDDRLANALQMFQKYHNDSRYSVALIENALSLVQDSIRDVQFTPLLDKQKLKRSGYVLMAVLVLLVLIFTGFRAPLQSASFQLLQPNRDMDTQYLSFQIWPGNVRIIKDTGVELRALVSDSGQTELNLLMGPEQVTLTRAGNDTFRHVIERVPESFDYAFSTKDQISESHTIHVEERPMLRYVQVTVSPPAYSGQAAFDLRENMGDVNALKGSHIRIEGRPNKQLDSARVKFASGAEIEMQGDARSVNAGFTVQRNDSYHFELTDTLGYPSNNPIEYNVRVIPDQYPVIRLLHPGRDVDLTDEMIVPLIMEAQDDFGIKRLALCYQVIFTDGEIDSARFVKQDLQGIDYNKDQLRVAMNWDLSESGMLPTEVMVYYIEAWDNDRVSGPKSARTPMFHARFPSMYEMYQQVAETQDETIRQMEEVYDKHRELEEKAETLSRELQRAKELDWERQQQAEQALEQQQEIKQQMQELEKNLQEIVETMEENDLASPETLEKYKELQDLYQEIMTPEMEDLMREMSQAMQQMDKNMLQKAMQDFKMSDDEMSKNLERTISLLKKLKIEQQLDQAIKMAEDMAERQRNMEERAENGTDERMSREQDNLSKDRESMGNDLEDLRRQMSEMPNMPMDDLDEAQSQLDSDSLDQAMQDMQKMMQSGDMSNYQKSSQQMQKTMQSVSQSLQQAKEKIDGTQQQKAMAALKRSIRQLLELSLDQEDLMQQTGDLPDHTRGIQDVADRQNNMLSGLDRVVNSIFELSKESMMLNTAMQSALGKAQLSMQETLSMLESRNSRQAARHQGESMMAMNDAILMMQQSMQNMMQNSGGGMSFEQFMQQMQQMAKGQQQLNQSTQEMSAQQQEAMARQAQMGRLAAQQEGLRKSMEQLAKEAGGMSDVLGDLDQIAQDMKEVEKDLNSQSISRETLMRQNRILSRMLDAQRSMREREYSRKREATTGKRYTTTSPGALPEDLGERENLLQRELLQAGKQGYSQDYMNLIREYFKALTEQESQYENVE